TRWPRDWSSDVCSSDLTQATLEHSGVPVLKALQTSACAVDNVLIEASIRRMAEEIEHGASMLEAMERQKLFPPMMLEMVAAGEQIGRASCRERGETRGD